MLYDVALVSPRCLWRPADAGDAPASYTVRRYVCRRVTKAEATRRAAARNTCRFDLDAWAVAIPHKAERARQPRMLLQDACMMLRFQRYSLAAVACLQALEATIQDIHAACGWPSHQTASFQGSVKALWQAGILDSHTCRRLLDLAQIGRMATDNRTLCVHEVLGMFRGVRRFLASCPVFAGKGGGA